MLYFSRELYTDSRFLFSFYSFQFGRCPARALFQDAVDLIRKINQDKPELFANFIQAKVSLKKAPEYYKLFNEMKIGKVAFVGTD